MMTDIELKLLQAAVDRIIPADDYPSGWEAGVGDYFLLLFAREPRFLPIYQKCLKALELEAQAVKGQSFAVLESDQQDALLASIELGHAVTVWEIDPREFFRLLVEQTMEGFYADPGNGGNTGRIAWEMIGYRVTA